MRLLFIEDSERLQRYVGAALRKEGYAVDVCGDGEDGLWQAETHDYDAIVLDLMLPKLDGLTVLERLRAGGKQTHVRLLRSINWGSKSRQSMSLRSDRILPTIISPPS